MPLIAQLLVESHFADRTLEDFYFFDNACSQVFVTEVMFRCALDTEIIEHFMRDAQDCFDSAV